MCERGEPKPVGVEDDERADPRRGANGGLRVAAGDTDGCECRRARDVRAGEGVHGR